MGKKTSPRPAQKTRVDHLRNVRQARGAASHSRGARAEALCRLALRLKFYRVLAQRYKTPLGEIDIIACRGDAVVFIEVKARPDLAQAGEAVSTQQQQRLARTAQSFLARHPHLANKHIRFDVMHVVPHRWPRHIENAFNPNASW